MPKIPQYGELKVEEQIAQPAFAKVDPNVYNQGTVNLLASTVVKMQQQAAESEAHEAVVNFERDKNNLFFNPDTGYFNTQGRDAYDKAKGVTDSLTELKAKYGDKLSSDIAKRAFDNVATQHITRANQDIMQHASKGLNAWEIGTIKSQVENTLENASLYWNDENRLKVQRELGRQNVMQAADKEGVSPETKNERLQTYESAFASATIEAATNKSSQDGKDALEKYKERLEGPDVVKMEKIIATKAKAEQTARDSGQATMFATAMLSKHGDSDTARQDIMEEVNQIKDPEIRKKAMKESMYQLDQKLKADSEEKGKIFENGENFIIKGGSIEQYKAMHPDEWNKMTPKQKRALESGESISTDFVALSNLLTLPKEKLAKVNPPDHFDSLSKTDRSKLINAVKAARQGGPEHQAGRTRISQTNAAVEQLFGKRSSWSTNDKKLINQFYSTFNDEVELREQSKGAPLTAKEYTEALNDMTREHVKKKSFLGIGYENKRDLTDLSAEDLKAISDYLHRNNIPATVDNIFKAYDQANQ